MKSIKHKNPEVVSTSEESYYVEENLFYDHFHFLFLEEKINGLHFTNGTSLLYLPL